MINVSELPRRWEEHLTGLDWRRIEDELEEYGYAKTPALVSPSECGALMESYSDDSRFRSRIEMEHYRFGAGEYKYFSEPLPPLIQLLRETIYGGLVGIANRWAGLMGTSKLYPPTLDEFLTICRTEGQAKPTPLLLHYNEGGYNCLHQDLYGAVSFPLQLTCVLSRVGHDFTGGEFILVEQRPRAQSRATAISLEQGELIIFPNSHRPVKGARGYHRVNMRHGVSRVTSGQRSSLGIIFHNAK